MFIELGLYYPAYVPLVDPSQVQDIIYSFDIDRLIDIQALI